jgi:uncharacterized RDD family membrane protein YckC
LQTSPGYIFRILQHFATKLRNITNFVMLFQAVMKMSMTYFLANKHTVLAGCSAFWPLNCIFWHKKRGHVALLSGPSVTDLYSL